MCSVGCSICVRMCEWKNQHSSQRSLVNMNVLKEESHWSTSYLAAHHPAGRICSPVATAEPEVQRGERERSKYNFPTYNHQTTS